jgi:hypothetical protein
VFSAHVLVRLAVGNENELAVGKVLFEIKHLGA